MRTTSDPTHTELPRQSLDLAFRALWKHRPDAVATVALGTSVLAVERRPATALVAERAPDGDATVLTAQGGCTRSGARTRTNWPSSACCSARGVSSTQTSFASSRRTF